MEQATVAPVHQTFGVGTHAPGTYINPEGEKHEIPNNIDMYLSTDTESSESTPPSKQRKMQTAEEAAARAAEEAAARAAEEKAEQQRQFDLLMVSVLDAFVPEKVFMGQARRLRASKIAMTVYEGWKTRMSASDEIRTSDLDKNCDIQSTLDKAIISCICRDQKQAWPYAAKSQQLYMEHTVKELNNFSPGNVMSSSVKMYAYVLFKRLLATFSGEHSKMESWFLAVPAGQFRENLHSFSEEAQDIAMHNGVMCTMYVMCLHFAFIMFEVEYLANDMYAAIVFWYAGTTTSFAKRKSQFKYDFALLQAATFKQLGYNVHVNFQDYMLGVQDLPLCLQTQEMMEQNKPALFEKEDKDDILQMLAELEKAHAEEFETDNCKYTEEDLNKSRPKRIVQICDVHERVCVCAREAEAAKNYKVAGEIKYAQQQLLKQEKLEWS
jgi:hypothetical protein